MTLVWHDWFATSNAGVGSQRLMLQQNDLFRDHALGSFRELLRAVTVNPAMLVWLSGHVEPERQPERELRARADGAVHARRRSRLHRGGRARAGARAHGLALGLGARHRPDELPLRPESLGRGLKGGLRTERGTFDYRDAVSLCLRIPAIRASSSRSSGATSSPLPPDRRTRDGLEALYRHDFQVRPLVEAILRHPALYTGPRQVKPPIVYLAGLLRGLGRPVDTTSWVWLGVMAGQRLFYPPNVAGWDDSRWLDTATFRGRWALGEQCARAVQPVRRQGPEGAEQPRGNREGRLQGDGEPDRPAQRRARC